MSAFGTDIAKVIWYSDSKGSLDLAAWGPYVTSGG
jgi:hypothetical protein